jgi:hypothetical protein
MLADQIVVATDIAEGGNGPHHPNMELITYRLAQHDKQLEAVGTQLTAIQGALTQLQLGIAALPTKENVRNWGMGLIVAILASFLSVGGLVLAASSNQLSAFQAGLSVIQTAIAVAQPLK